MTQQPKDKILIIYTGGTIGCLPKDRDDPLSPFTPAPLEEVMNKLPNFDPVEMSISIEGKSIKLGTYSFRKPVDSSDLQVENWIEIARVIMDSYDDYDGFVVLHGTDIMAYTASALAFMFMNLGKPVVLTGSQRPIAQTRTDAIQNVITAIELAAAHTLGHPLIPEVCVFFQNEIYRGCRTTKIDAGGFKAFDTPNYPPLGNVGAKVKISKNLLKPVPARKINLRDNLQQNVASIVIFPGMSVNLLRSMLAVDGLKGVVLLTYGSGNMPSHLEFLETIYEAAQRGVVVIDVTQCKSGEVELGLYETSEKLLSQGVISGIDMTPEAALTKMMVVLGTEDEKEVQEDLLQINLRGEQSHSLFYLHFPKGRISESTTSLTLEQNRPMTFGLERYNSDTLEVAFLRMTGLRISGKIESGKIELAFYIDLPENGDVKSTDNPNFLCSFSKSWSQESGWGSVLIPVTEKIKPFIDNQHTNTLTVVNVSATAIRWEKLDLVFYVDC
jgi:L-asparaginase